MGLNKLEEEELEPSVVDDTVEKLEPSVSGDDVYSEIMKTVEAQLEAATYQAVAVLKSVLMLDDDYVSAQLLAKLEEFRKHLIVELEDDLVDVVESCKSKRSTDGPLSDEERYEFLTILQARWEATLTKDIEEFQNSILPKWVSSVRDTWKGIEKEVMTKIERFKLHVRKTSPRLSDTCALPRPILQGTESLSGASKSTDLYRGSVLGTLGKAAIFLLAVSGVICLALFAPFYFYLLGVFALIDWISMKIFM
jgi:hypothetical protein